MSYATICSHPRLERIDANFVRCLQCGQSMISQKREVRNKTRQDFTREQPQFVRNFDRNFSNELVETSRPSQSRPLYEYYTDKLGVNSIVIDRRVLFDSDPAKYRCQVNGQTSNLTQTDIHKLLAEIGAFRIDADMFNQLEASYSDHSYNQGKKHT